MTLELDATPEDLQIWLPEAEEHLQLLDQELVRLERDASDPELLQEIFRAAHTLKGSSAAIKHFRMAEVTHALENVLDDLRNGALSVSSNLDDVLLDTLDALRILRDEVITREENPDLDVAAITARLHAVQSDHETQAVGVAAPPSGSPDFTSLTVAQLRALAIGQGVALDGARRKADIIAVLQSSIQAAAGAAQSGAAATVDFGLNPAELQHLRSMELLGRTVQHLSVGILPASAMPAAPPGAPARSGETGRTGPTSPAAPPGAPARSGEAGRIGPTSPATSAGPAARTDAPGAANRTVPSAAARATPLPLTAEGRVASTGVPRPSAPPAPPEGTRAATATPSSPAQPRGVETTLAPQPAVGAQLGDEFRRALEVLGSSVERHLLDGVSRGSGVLELRAVLAEAVALLEDEQVAARDQEVRGGLRQLRALLSELESSFEATRLVNAAPRGDASQNSYLFSVPVRTPAGWTSAELEIFRRGDGRTIDPDDFRIAIRLDLPHLKEVKITVSVREQLVSCAFTCEQLDGLHALEQAQAELVQGLHGQGFRTGRFTHALLAIQDTTPASVSVPPGRLDTRA